MNRCAQAQSAKKQLRLFVLQATKSVIKFQLPAQSGAT